MKRKSLHNRHIPHSLLLIFLLAACSFDYGNQDSGDSGLPDIVMESVEYVRIRSSDPQARFQAERVERYEERRIMELRNFSFEQFGNHGEEVNAFGMAGGATIEIDSMDVSMRNGVRIEVESEDIAIETSRLEWKDKARTLSSGEFEEVNIYRENGTSFIGTGFKADARQRTWEFTGAASGAYIHEDDEKEKAKEEIPKEENSKEEISKEETSKEEAANEEGGTD